MLPTAADRAVPEGGRKLGFFSTITVFGTPRDVTIDELHIECCFPMDEATAELCRALARDDAGADAGTRD